MKNYYYATHFPVRCPGCDEASIQQLDDRIVCVQCGYVLCIDDRCERLEEVPLSQDCDDMNPFLISIRVNRKKTKAKANDRGRSFESEQLNFGFDCDMKS